MLNMFIYIFIIKVSSAARILCYNHYNYGFEIDCWLKKKVNLNGALC